MKITVVVDNCVPISAPGPFLGEHGVSLLVEIGNRKILADTGQSFVVVHNLSLIGLHPNELDAVVISHGHYDHTGGLHHLLKHRRKALPVIAHSGIGASRFSIAKSPRRYIGVSPTIEELTTLGADWHFSDVPVKLGENLWFGGQIPRIVPFEKGDANLVICDQSGCDCQDVIDDDSSLFFSSKEGLVVIAGCTHSGLVNTVEYGFKVSGQNNLKGWIGGTHLGLVGSRQQSETVSKLKSYSPDFVAANHCTGFAMMCRLANLFEKKFIPAFVSTVIEC